MLASSLSRSTVSGMFPGILGPVFSAMFAGIVRSAGRRGEDRPGPRAFRQLLCARRLRVVRAARRLRALGGCVAARTGRESADGEEWSVRMPWCQPTVLAVCDQVERLEHQLADQYLAVRDSDDGFGAC